MRSYLPRQPSSCSSSCTASTTGQCHLFTQYRSMQFIYLFKYDPLQYPNQIQLKIYSAFTSQMGTGPLYKQRYSLAEIGQASGEASATYFPTTLKVPYFIFHNPKFPIPAEYQPVELNPTSATATKEKLLASITECCQELRQEILMQELPPHFTCPLTLALLKTPVIDVHGHTFEKEAITRWLTTNARCPLNNEKIAAGQLNFNLQLKNSIDEYFQRLPPLVRVEFDEVQPPTFNDNFIPRLLPKLIETCEADIRESTEKKEAISITQINELLGLYEKTQCFNKMILFLLYVMKCEICQQKQPSTPVFFKQFKEILQKARDSLAESKLQLQRFLLQCYQCFEPVEQFSSYGLQLFEEISSQFQSNANNPITAEQVRRISEEMLCSHAIQSLPDLH